MRALEKSSSTEANPLRSGPGDPGSISSYLKSFIIQLNDSHFTIKPCYGPQYKLLDSNFIGRSCFVSPLLGEISTLLRRRMVHKLWIIVWQN